MDSVTTTSVETTTAPASLRRTKQNSNDTQSAVNGSSNAEKSFIRKYRHVAAIHSKSKPSTLSHDAEVAPSFLGFRNLMVIVLVVGNLRLVIENIQKYGNLVCLTCHDFRRKDLLLGVGLYFLIPCFLWVALSIELVAARQAKASRALAIKQGGSSSPTEDQQKAFKATWVRIRWLHGLNSTLALSITSWVVYNHIHHPLIGTITEIHTIIVWLKTASYALTNRDLRHAYLHPVKGELAALPELYAQCPYPQNITMKNLTYFWWAPTLVYQPVYPRSEKIRWNFVFKRIGEVVCLSVFIWFCSAQYAAPVLQNSLDSINHLKLASILERLLKLSTISLVIWLAGFFAVFQSTLNALAEVTRFGDRSFYDDWWNAASLGDYWRLWNKPVYQFMKRHVYSPMLGRGYNQLISTVAVFFVSAILHELAVGVPTHNILGIAFLGMLLQLPLIIITAKIQKIAGPKGQLIGNCTFWVSFTILGQPFAALMYFYAWQAKYGSVSKQVTPLPANPGC
ncbi:MBOAT, membrane-bound O-acyltransferase family-domain-containing protein [Xylariales sp. PMI_506]|nr:MBOAT, membrane-bound O-acyltransferase family-domain-containing protein [Xylariales sp. PMI_506]